MLYCSLKKKLRYINFSKLFVFAFSLPYTVFFTTSLLTASLNVFKSIETALNLSTSKSSIFVFKSFKQVETLTNSFMSILPTSAFQARETLLAVKLDVSTTSACYILFLAAYFDKSTTLTLFLI